MAEPDSNPVIISRKEARTKGLRHFFTGKCCKNGHCSNRLVSCGSCTACYKETYKETQNLYRKSHRAEAVERVRRWRSKNMERKRESDRMRYHANPCAQKAANQRWQDSNPGSRPDVTRRWKERNRDKVRKKNARWAKNNRGKIYAKHHKRRAKLRNAPGSFTDDEIKEIFKAQRGCCAYCRAKLKKFHRDHIVSIARGGTNYARNIQLLCGFCNSSKRDRDPIEYAQSLGRMI